MSEPERAVSLEVVRRLVIMIEIVLLSWLAVVVLLGAQ